MKVLITDKINESAGKILEGVAQVDFIPTLPEDELAEKIKDYDAVIAYCYNGNLWTMSIYSDASKDFDCAEFAKKFSGGGHKKAAGFRTTEFPDWLKATKEE